MHNPMLMRDYEVPKKSMFLLEGREIVQSRDAAAYISNSVTDSVMYGTNGNLGLRHRSEMETIGFKTGVMLNGVYHIQPRESAIRCSALPTEYHTGAAICTIDLDCRIDGDSGTLSSVPARRLSLEDGAYRSECEDVMSSDGHVIFDTHYIRAVGTSDLSAWSADVCYKNFRISTDASSDSEHGGFSDDPPSPWMTAAGYTGHTNPSVDSNDNRGVGRISPQPITSASWRMELLVNFSVDLDDWEVLKASQMDEVWQRSLTSNMLVNSMTEVTCTAHYPGAVSGGAVTADGVDCDASSYTSSNGGGILLSSFSGGVAPTASMLSGEGTNMNNPAASSTTASSVANGPTSRRIAPEVTIVTSVEDGDGTTSPATLQRYTTSAFVSDRGDGFADGDDVTGVVAGSAGGSPMYRGSSGGTEGFFPGSGRGAGGLAGSAGASAVAGGARGGTGGGSGINTRVLGDRLGSFMYTMAGSPTRSGGGGRRFVITKRFPLQLTSDCVPSSIVLSFRGRHIAGNNNGNAFPRPVFLSVEEMVKERKKSLDAFWATHEVDLQLQEELVPNRTKLALMYNSFRLFGVSYNLENGLPRSGCSCSGDALQLDLRQYLYHGVYYLLTDPPSCLALLRSLYKMLPQSRRNARKLSLSHGAIYPECTITGVNTKFYTNVMDARFYVNAHIGFLIHVYSFSVTTIAKEDRLWMLEMMLETARVWVALGDWRKEKTAFYLENLSGPDEYNANGNGNFYVHLSAKHHLSTAVKLIESEEKLVGVDAVKQVLDRIRMTHEEISDMRRASEVIVFPRDELTGAYMVHEHFDTLTPWSRNERTKHPLNLNYHPLAIFRHKIVDMPEVLLGLITHEWMFDSKDFERNLSYYAPLCTGDTPESLAFLAICLCRARENFAQPVPLIRSMLHLDLDNIMYLAEEGLHFGPMSAGLLAFIVGVGGLSFTACCLHLNPLLPAGVNRYSFTVSWQDAKVRTTLDSDTLTYELISGDSIRFIHGSDNNRIHLHTGFRRVAATRKLTIPRRHFSQIRQFDGAVFLSDCLFHNLLEYSYVSWLRTLESLFDNYRALHQRQIKPLTPEEFIENVVYQQEEEGIAFSGIHRVLLERDISLELGTPDDAEIVETRYGLANAKVADMAELLAQRPPRVNPDLFHLVRGLAHSGVACAIVTYNRSLKQLMFHSSALANFFVARIDGEEAHDRCIRGRPHLDLFLKAAEKIHVDPKRCLVVSHHLDRHYTAEAFSQFRMFLDIDDPFVSSRVKPAPYPTLDEAGIAKSKRDNPVVWRLGLDEIATKIDDLEDIIEGRPVKRRV